MSARKITVSEPSETEKLIDYVNQHGLKAAAVKYGAHPSTLSRWIRVQGYEMVRQYRRKAEREQALNEFFQQLAEIEAATS